jgi:hypothetical protein
MNRLEKIGSGAWLLALALAAIPAGASAATGSGLFETGICLTPATFAAFLLTPTATLGRVLQERLSMINGGKQ